MSLSLRPWIELAVKGAEEGVAAATDARDVRITGPDESGNRVVMSLLTFCPRSKLSKELTSFVRSCTTGEYESVMWPGSTIEIGRVYHTGAVVIWIDASEVTLGVGVLEW